MANYEAHSATQEAIDQAVVRDMFNEIEGYISAEDESGWAEAYKSAWTYIDELYGRFIPEIDGTKRAAANHLGSIALAFVDLTYGEDERHPHIYAGTEEEGVPATYHNGAHSRGVIYGIVPTTPLPKTDNNQVCIATMTLHYSLSSEVPTMQK
jgi:hypothetical protein